MDNLNRLLAGTDYAALSLEEIIAATSGRVEAAATFNNAAQIWNHTFYWKSLRAKEGGEPPAALKEKMAATFGSVDGCKKELASMAVSQFASGWGWLVLDGDKLKVVKTANAETPLTTRMKPLLINTLQQYTAEQREQAVEETEKALKKLDVRIDELETRVDNNWDKTTQAARQKARDNLKALRQQRNELAEWYGSLKISSVDAWEQIKGIYRRLPVDE